MFLLPSNNRAKRREDHAAERLPNSTANAPGVLSRPLDPFVSASFSQLLHTVYHILLSI